MLSLLKIQRADSPMLGKSPKLSGWLLMIAILLGSVAITSGALLSVLSAQTTTTLAKLTDAEVAQQLKNLPGWTVKDQELTRVYEFKNFLEAIKFVNQLVEPAEKAAHHPDLEISYNKVTIKLTTHDLNGLTQQDFDLAKIIDDLN